VAAEGVSACVPVLNGARFLDQALRSIVHQTRPPDEVVVVDGGSTDDSVAIAEGFGARVVRQSGRGQAEDFNATIRASREDLIAFCAADDIWTPTKLEAQLAHMAAHPEVMFSHTHFIFLAEPGWEAPPGFNTDLLGRSLPGPMPESMMARRDVFERVGTFDLTFGSAFDADWFARARDAGILSSMLPDALLLKRLHSSNLFVTEENARHLFQALRRSVERKQAGG
jgi:glycosyltransferase involved in cell wall biosynthesis